MNNAHSGGGSEGSSLLLHESIPHAHLSCQYGCTCDGGRSRMPLSPGAGLLKRHGCPRGRPAARLIDNLDAGSRGRVGAPGLPAFLVWRRTPDLPRRAPDFPVGVPEVPDGAPDVPGDAPEVPGGVPDLPRHRPEVPDPAPDLPRATPDLPQDAPDLPGSMPDSPWRGPDLPRSGPELPRCVPEVPWCAPVVVATCRRGKSCALTDC